MKERGRKLCRRLFLYVLYKILHHEDPHACFSGEVTAKNCTKRFDHREQNDYFWLGLVDTILDSFYHYEKLSCIV